MSRRLRDLADAIGATTPPAHLDALQGRFAGRARALGELQREIAEEMGASLGRAARRVTAALEELAELERRIAGAEGGDDRELVKRLCQDFNDRRQHAAKRLRELRIQREALGFRRNDELVRQYPIPARKHVPE